MSDVQSEVERAEVRHRVQQAAAYIEELDRQIALAQAKAIRARWLAIGVLAQIVVAGAFCVVWVIATVSSRDTETARCVDRFVSAQREANLNAFAVLTEQVNVLIPQDPPLDDSERMRELDRLRDLGRNYVTEYDELVREAATWGEAGRPLPCPLGPTGLSIP